MAMGKAIVSTSLGCEGFGLVAGQDVILADEPEEFGAAVVALLRDAGRRERLGAAARRFAAQHDWHAIVHLMEEVYDGTARDWQSGAGDAPAKHGNIKQVTGSPRQ